MHSECITQQYVTTLSLNAQKKRRGLICGCVEHEHEPPASFTAEREREREMTASYLPTPFSSAPQKVEIYFGNTHGWRRF